MMNHNKSVVLAALLLAACSKDDAKKIALPPEAAPPAAAAPARVETIVAAAADVAAPVHATGTSQPIRKADLAPAMSARIEKIYVREGQRVAAGQLLVALDGRTAQLSAEQARQAAAASAAQADQLEADYKRLEPLAERGSIAASRLEQLDSQRKAARAQARAAHSAANAASRAADNAILRAPFAGTIVDLPHEVGELASMSPLARLVDLSQLEIHVRVAARELGRISLGDPAAAAFPQLGVTAQGSISSIGFEVDPTTSTAEVVAVIPNPDGKLRGGLFTELRIAPSARQRAILVPKTAILGAGPQANVFVVTGGKALRRAVEIAPFDDARVEIVKGIEDQTVLVAAQLDRVNDGAPVTGGAAPQHTTLTAKVEP